jgi:hypothetical protein
VPNADCGAFFSSLKDDDWVLIDEKDLRRLVVHQLFKKLSVLIRNMPEESAGFYSASFALGAEFARHCHAL